MRWLLIYTLVRFRARMVLPDSRIYWKEKFYVNVCFKYRICISFSLYSKKTHSNSMKDKYFRINRLTDLTFDSASSFKSQLSYLLTSYSLASNLSLDSSRELSVTMMIYGMFTPKSHRCVPHRETPIEGRL